MTCPFFVVTGITSTKLNGLYFQPTMSKFSKTQIDKLGDRLRSGVFTEADLRMLDEYRHSYEGTYQSIVEVIRNSLEIDPTGRAEKSTPSIIDKLQRRETQYSRLSQIQDIAGCRIVVNNISEQEDALEILKEKFRDFIVVDRRRSPSHGYRALHFVIKMNGRQIEVQIRTRLQHAWAQTSEKIADLVDPQIKYGAGQKDFRGYLEDLSRLIRDIEDGDKDPDSDVRIMEARPEYLGSGNDATVKIREEVATRASDLVGDLSRWIAFNGGGRAL